MPDGSLAPDIAEIASLAKRSRRRDEPRPAEAISALVGNPTGLMFRLREVEDRLTSMDSAVTAGRHSYEGRSLQRMAEALLNLAVELTPANMADCVAIISAANEKISDAEREARDGLETRQLLEAPMNALSRVENSWHRRSGCVWRISPATTPTLGAWHERAFP